MIQINILQRRMKMIIIDAIQTIAKYTEKITDSINQKDTELFHEYIEKVYDLTKNVYNDFMNILYEIQRKLKNKELSVDDAVSLLDDGRLPFKCARQELRSTLNIKFYEENEETIRFAIAVYGVLQGGLHWSTELNLEHLHSLEDLIELRLKGAHTIVDLMVKYDRKHEESLYYNKYYIHYLGGVELDEKIEIDLLSDIRQQINILDKYWKKLTNSYASLKFKKLK